jgi:predicted enzyme related to lactoylglutathione lyase
MPTGPRTIHEFCWVNILTPSPAEAKSFFSELFS